MTGDRGGRARAAARASRLAVLIAACAACGTGQSIERDQGFPTPGTLPWEKVDADPEAENLSGTQCTVFSLSILEEVREPWVVESGGLLKMYYAAAVRGTIGVTESASGLAWGRGQDVLLPTLEWEGRRVGAPSVVVVGASWTMWYAGEGGIGIARSTNGERWTKAPAADGRRSPVLAAAEEWEGGRVGSPSVLVDPDAPAGERFKMWYEGGEGAGIGYAVSADGVVWTRPFAAPIVARGEAGQWDSAFAGTPHVLAMREDDGRLTYKMWYTGGNSANLSIGEAASFDGVAWVKNRLNPAVDELMLLNPADPIDEREPAVLPWAGEWILWFSQLQAMPPERGICAATKQ